MIVPRPLPVGGSTVADELLPELDDDKPDADRVLFARLLRGAAGMSVADWVMSGEVEKRVVHVVGLMRLLKAAGGCLFRYADLPPRSPGRSVILLKGAATLGIETPWKGWPE